MEHSQKHVSTQTLKIILPNKYTLIKLHLPYRILCGGVFLAECFIGLIKYEHCATILLYVWQLPSTN